MTELIIYKRPESKLFLNYSPFCAKTEIFLKLNKIEHTIQEFKGNPNKFSKAKLPVLNMDNKMIQDSYFIEHYLTRTKKLPINDHLSSLEKAHGYTLTKMMEEYLYWAILSERWLEDKNWIELRDSYFTDIPNLIRPLITGMIRKNVKQSAHGHGMARHTPEEMHHLGTQSLETLSQILGKNDFILGNKVSSYDSTVYAFLSNLLYCSFSPRLQKESQKFDNFKPYCERMLELTNS